MRFLLGRRKLLIIDRNGVRIHNAAFGTYFDRGMIKGKVVTILKPEGEGNQEMAYNLADQAIDRVLAFHADRTKHLLGLVLECSTATEASEIIKSELDSIEQQIAERNKAAV